MTDTAQRETLRAANRQMTIFLAALLATILLAVLLPDLVPPAARSAAADLFHARVVSIVQPNPPPQGVPQPSSTEDGGRSSPSPGESQDQGGGPTEAIVEFLDGRLAGQNGQAIVQGPSGSLQLPDYRAGDEVVVEVDTSPDGTTSMIVVDRWRLRLLETLVALLAVAAAAVAGWRGLRAIVALALTLVLTLRLFVPLVILGWNPVGLAIVFGILVTTLSFMLTQGFNRTTVSAIAGTTLGLGVTGLLAAIVTAAAAFTPAQGSEQVVYLSQLTNSSIDLSGLLLAAVIFGGLGVLNDVAISQAVTVEELHRADPKLTGGQLFGRSMNVGASHLAATINTLVFAYLGTALPLVVLIVLQISNVAATASEEGIAVEVVRTVVGVLGVLAAVPITTAIAALTVTRTLETAAVKPLGEPGAPPS